MVGRARKKAKVRASAWDWRDQGSIGEIDLWLLQATQLRKEVVRVSGETRGAQWSIQLSTEGVGGICRTVEKGGI